MAMCEKEKSTPATLAYAVPLAHGSEKKNGAPSLRSRLAQLNFFDLPVYRLPPEKYHADMSKWIDESMYHGTPEHIAFTKAFHERNPEHKLRFEAHLNERYGGAWLYNEIIGYIRLHFLGSQVRGEYFAVKAKRIVSSRTKLFEFKTHKLALESEVPRHATNAEILGVIQEYIKDCATELKGRYIDDSLFNVMAPHVNWKALYEQRA